MPIRRAVSAASSATGMSAVPAVTTASLPGTRTGGDDSWLAMRETGS